MAAKNLYLRISLVLLGFGLLSSFPVHSMQKDVAQLLSNPKWTPKSLHGTISFNAGPNCFNGTLAAAGFVDELVFTSSAEIRFYTENFCKEVPKKADQAGDIWLFESEEDTLIHAVLNLGTGKIFEKKSLKGSIDTDDFGEDGLFAVKKKTDSPFLMTSKHPLYWAREKFGYSHIKKVRCQPAQQVRQSVSKFLNDPLTRQIYSMRNALENLNSDKNLKTLPANLEKPLLNLLENLQAKDSLSQEDLYQQILLESLVGHLFNLAAQLEGHFPDQYEHFKVLNKLSRESDRLRGLLKPLVSDPKSQKILAEIFEEGSY